MAGRLPNRARGRTAKSNSGANSVIASLRSREQVEQPDAPADIAKVEKAPVAPVIARSVATKQPSKKPTQNPKDPPSSMRQFITNHKKGTMITTVVALLIVAGVAASILVQGPMQFLQFASLIENSIQFMSDSVSSTRIARNIVAIAQGESYNAGVSTNNRLAKMGRLVTDAYTEKLATRGIEFDGGPKITIRLEKRYGQKKYNEKNIKQKVSEDFGININSLSYHEGDNTITFETTGSDWTDDVNKRFLLSLESEVGNYSLKEISTIRRTKTTTRLGLHGWRHQITHADLSELRRAMGYLDGSGYLEAWYGSRLARMMGVDISASNMDASLAKKLQEILDEKMIKRTMNIDLSSLGDEESNEKMLLALAMACVDYNIFRPTQMYAKVMMPAIMEAMAIRSLEGQIRSVGLNTLTVGLQDFTYDDLAGPSMDFFYDIGISGWSSSPVKAAMGYDTSENEKAATVDYALRFNELYNEVIGVNSPERVVGSELLTLCRELLNNSTVWGLSDVVRDFITTALNGAAVDVLSWIWATLKPEQGSWSKMVVGDKEYSLQTFSMNPAQKLSTVMYGSKYLEDFDNITLGGRKLDDSELAALQNGNRIDSVENHQSKSVAEKLFDASDYRSAIATIARDSGWNTTSNSPATHIANIAKTFSKIPTSFLSQIGKIFSKNASAGSFNIAYNYGTNWYGYSHEEQKKLRDLNDSTVTAFSNAEKLYSMISTTAGANDVNDTAISCFATVVARDGTLAKINNALPGRVFLNNSGSFNMDYAAGMAFSYSDCHVFGLTTEELMVLRTYILDYNLLSAASCYEGSVSQDSMFDSNGSGSKDMKYVDLGVYACYDFGGI